MSNKSVNLKLLQIQIKLFIATILIGLLLFVIISSKAKAYSNDDGKGNRRNMFYVQVINYALPMVRVNTFDEGDMAENEFSLKDKVLKVVGIDSNNPMSILGKEVACIKEYSSDIEVAENSNEIEKVDIAVNPFNLNESSINKNGDAKTQVPPSTNTGSSNSETSGNINVVVDNPNIKKAIDVGKPVVFIYHTHTTEGYGVNDVDTMDANKSVVAVGDVIAKELESKYGISVIHDKTVHDAQSYNLAYTRSRATVDSYIKKYGDFRLMIDIHRDSVKDRKYVVKTMNGQNVARYMFVMDKNNSHYKQNLALVNKMVGISEKLFPGYIRDARNGKGIYAYNSGTGHFNQDKGQSSILIEVGSHVNTPQEAIASAPYLARILAECLNGKN